MHNNEYVNYKPPKTTARGTFGDGEAQQLIHQCSAVGLSKYDTVATITRITAQNIVEQYQKFYPRHSKINEMWMCGGGARNPNIIEYLKKRLPNTAILKLDDVGVPSDAKEAVSFAQQGLEALLGRAALVSINSDTMTPNTISGKISPGLRWRDIMTQAMSFGKGEKLRTVKEMIFDSRYTDWKPMATCFD